MKRRKFIKIVLSMVSLLAFHIKSISTLKIWAKTHTKLKSNSKEDCSNLKNIEMSKVYLAKSDVDQNAIVKLINSMGGVKEIIGNDDIVVIKVNAQRYNQGMTNTDQLKQFIDLILNMVDSFNGEIIVADNHQYNEDNCCGWTTENRNGRFNLNELVEYFQEKGHKNVTKYHWHVAGSCKYPLEGDGQGFRKVNGPEEGDGYVWMKERNYISPNGRKCMMTYPIFTSKYSGITIDLKNGAWKNGHYLDRKLKLINFASLNHHGYYAGVTASIKNLMGVVDMTCGFPGDKPEGTYNTHHIGVSELKHWLYYKAHWRLKHSDGFLKHKFLEYCYKDFHHTGGVLGYFMKNVRMPDIHIIAAEIVGWGGRKDPKLAFYSGTALASKDPVALDYIAAKYILLPNTPKTKKEKNGELLTDLHNPDLKNGKFRKFLIETYKQGVGTLNKEKIKLINIS